MYFVYTKEINIASQRSYSTQEMVTFFIDNFNPINEKYFDQYGINDDVDNFVAHIFEMSETWFDSFCSYIDLEESLLKDMYQDDIINQISDTVEDALFDYFSEHWDEYIKIYQESK